MLGKWDNYAVMIKWKSGDSGGIQSRESEAVMIMYKSGD